MWSRFEPEGLGFVAINMSVNHWSSLGSSSDSLWSWMPAADPTRHPYWSLASHLNPLTFLWKTRAGSDKVRLSSVLWCSAERCQPWTRIDVVALILMMLVMGSDCDILFIITNIKLNAHVPQHTDRQKQKKFIRLSSTHCRSRLK